MTELINLEKLWNKRKVIKRLLDLIWLIILVLTILMFARSIFPWEIINIFLPTLILYFYIRIYLKCLFLEKREPKNKSESIIFNFYNRCRLKKREFFGNIQKKYRKNNRVVKFSSFIGIFLYLMVYSFSSYNLNSFTPFLMALASISITISAVIIGIYFFHRNKSKNKNKRNKK